MESFSLFFIYSLTAIFIENTVFVRAIGTGKLIELARDKTQFFPFCFSLIAIVTVSGAIVYPVTKLLSEWKYKLWFEPLAYCLVMLTVCIVACSVVYFVSGKKKKLTGLLISSCFNCAALGSLVLPAHSSITETVTLLSTTAFSFGTGIGFLFAMLLIHEWIPSLSSHDIPETYRGIPATLLYIGILSLAFYGFIGNALPY